MFKDKFISVWFWVLLLFPVPALIIFFLPRCPSDNPVAVFLIDTMSYLVPFLPIIFIVLCIFLLSLFARKKQWHSFFGVLVAALIAGFVLFAVDFLFRIEELFNCFNFEQWNIDLPDV